jgi:hypothetical protein
MTHENGQSNVVQVVSYLSHRFANAIQNFPGKNVKGTPLYKCQVEFCYLIDEIQRGPVYITPKLITMCNEYIDDVAKKKTELLESRVSEPVNG